VLDLTDFPRIYAAGHATSLFAHKLLLRLC